VTRLQKQDGDVASVVAVARSFQLTATRSTEPFIIIARASPFDAYCCHMATASWHYSSARPG